MSEDRTRVLTVKVSEETADEIEAVRQDIDRGLRAAAVPDSASRSSALRALLQLGLDAWQERKSQA